MDQGSLKLVFAGPVGAGKTTAIRAIADCEPISTEMPITTGNIGDKTTTTVAFDFVSIMLDDGTPLMLYGLPGQEHYAFMRPIIMDGAIGVLLVLNATQGEIGLMCDHWLTNLLAVDPQLALVIGITHSERVPGFSMGAVRSAIRRFGRPIPAFTFDARDRAQAMHLVRALLLSARLAH